MYTYFICLQELQLIPTLGISIHSGFMMIVDMKLTVLFTVATVSSRNLKSKIKLNNIISFFSAV